MSAELADFKRTVIINTLRGCQLFMGLPPADLANIADQVAQMIGIKP